MFEKIGGKIDNAISWMFTFEGNDIQLFLWSGVISMIVVFVVEQLRKPRVKIDLIKCGFDFNLPQYIYKERIKEYYDCINSKNWKLKVEHKKSFLNNLFFRYSLNNLKVKTSFFSLDEMIRRKGIVLKADINPNIYEERDVPSALRGINLTKGESDLFPFINKNSLGWLPFDVWKIFLSDDKDRKEFLLAEGVYYLCVNVTSDQSFKKNYFKFFIGGNDLQIEQMSFFEKIKVKYFDKL